MLGSLIVAVGLMGCQRLYEFLEDDVMDHS